jgi:hypothetical protein
MSSFLSNPPQDHPRVIARIGIHHGRRVAVRLLGVDNMTCSSVSSNMLLMKSFCDTLRPPRRDSIAKRPRCGRRWAGHNAPRGDIFDLPLFFFRAKRLAPALDVPSFSP